MVLQSWFAHPLLLSLLLVLVGLAAFQGWAHHRRREALVRLGGPQLVVRLLGPFKVNWLRGLTLTFGLLLLILGIAGPQWGRDWTHATAPGRDVILVLDGSRSMFAEQPSRLERARRALLDLLQEFQRRGGHRVALVLFAGKAELACPLTHDYDHVRELVNRLTPEDLEIRFSAERGSGTRIGQALRVALDAHDPRFPGATDILLLSDGDDPARDGEWLASAMEANQKGIPVHTIGIGNPDPDQAAVIPRSQGSLVFEGQVVKTTLDEAPLREIAQMTRGTYIPAHNRALPLGRVYLDTIATLLQREESDDALPVYQPRYPWFLMPALGLLTLNLLLGDRSRRTIGGAKG